NLGEAVTSLSFAMFYNRIGWVALGALLVMYLLPRRVRPYQERLDVACATLLTLVMLYTKATYGLVALAFLVFLLSDPRQRRVAASVLALTGLAVLLVEAVWQGSAQYIADLVLTGKVSGTRGPESLVLGFLRHLSDYVLFAVLAALVLWRTCSLRDLLFFGFCAVPGLLIQAQNSQPWGIITLHAGAVVAAEFLLRSETREKARTLASGSIFLVAALLLPTMIHYALGLGIHTSLAVAQAGRPFGLPAFEQVRFTLPWAPGEYGFMGRYLDTIEDGAKALSGLPGRPERVSVLDFANPFSAGLNLPPPRGDNAWLHWGRNVSAEHFIPPEEMFRDVRFLMLPKWGINPVPLRDLYGAYVDANFDHAAETDFWIVAARRGTGADEMAKGGSSVDACSATEPARAWRVGAGYGCPQ
ncbi:MAG TPA: hypothetical protein VEZ16_13815, partial [Microvirga sp.]|nr:hypothetical protein [Microvirga sp.]